MKRLSNILIVLSFVMMIVGCTSKHLTKSKVTVDSTATTEQNILSESVTTETIDTTVTVDGSVLEGLFDLNDTCEQTIESDGLKLSGKVNPKTGKVKLKAESKPKEIKVQGSKVTASKTNSNSKGESHVKKTESNKELKKSGIPWQFYVIGSLVLVALAVFYFLGKRMKKYLEAK